MDKKILNKQSKIKMGTFLRSCLKVDNEYVIDVLSRLTHKEFKTVCHEIYDLYVSSIPFDAVELEDLYDGSIVLVCDVHGNVAPYKNPSQKNINDIHTEISSYTVPKFSYHDALDEVEYYEDIIDMIEENLTIESIDISSVGSFDIPNKGISLIKKGW